MVIDSQAMSIIINTLPNNFIPFSQGNKQPKKKIIQTKHIISRSVAIKFNNYRNQIERGFIFCIPHWVVAPIRSHWLWINLTAGGSYCYYSRYKFALGKKAFKVWNFARPLSPSPWQYKRQLPTPWLPQQKATHFRTFLIGPYLQTRHKMRHAGLKETTIGIER